MPTENVARMLNDCLATVLIAHLRYRRHASLGSGALSRVVQREMKRLCEQQTRAADALSLRIRQLGGLPDFAPDSLLARSLIPFSTADGMQDMLDDDLAARRILIDYYRVLVKVVTATDPTTRLLVEHLLAWEETAAEALQSMRGTDFAAPVSRGWFADRTGKSCDS